MDKPKRVLLLHVPVYEDDDIILNQAPPTAKGQWARQLILRHLQNEIQGKKLRHDEIKKAIQEEVHPLIDNLDDKMDKVIEEKLEARMQDLIKDIPYATATEKKQTPSDEPKSDVPSTPGWLNEVNRSRR